MPDIEPIIINIPAAKPTPQQMAWVNGWIAIVRKAGADPRKLISVTMGEAIFLEYMAGRYAEATVIHMIKNLIALNPALAAKQGGS